MDWTRFVRAAASAEADRVRAQIRAAVRSVALLAVASVLLLIGVIFTLTGLYGSLADALPQWQAGGLIGLGLLLVCLLLVAAARRGTRRAAAAAPPPRPPRPTADDLEASAELGAAASSAARDFVARHRPHTWQLALAAFVFGLIASRQPPRRKRDKE
ncbi:MAG TPA: phage holin family protein [Pseudomonadales bacterium]